MHKDNDFCGKIYSIEEMSISISGTARLMVVVLFARFWGKPKTRLFKFRHGNAIRGSFDTDEDSIRAQSGKIMVVSLA